MSLGPAAIELDLVSDYWQTQMQRGASGGLKELKVHLRDHGIMALKGTLFRAVGWSVSEEPCASIIGQDPIVKVWCTGCAKEFTRKEETLVKDLHKCGCWNVTSASVARQYANTVSVVSPLVTARTCALGAKVKAGGAHYMCRACCSQSSSLDDGRARIPFDLDVNDPVPRTPLTPGP
ncbi:hypothetical protein BS17DRAFT_831490 [Gyrodon lividus]|nr:hypothetical protein BS17DRAFT_831490 [Gyrodon lividus]